MPFTNEQSMELLEAPTIVEILHLFIRILQKKRDNDGIFVCSNCNRCLACVEDMATIAGAEGRIGAYVNPHGMVYIRHTYILLILLIVILILILIIILIFISILVLIHMYIYIQIYAHVYIDALSHSYSRT